MRSMVNILNEQEIFHTHKKNISNYFIIGENATKLENKMEK